MDRNIADLRKKLIGKAKKQVGEKYSGRESHAMRAAALIQDLDASFNLLAEHCIEWYSMHFPELPRITRDNVLLLKLVYFLGDRKNFNKKSVSEYSKEKAEKIAEKAKKSMGSKIEENSLKEVKLLALNALNIKEEREALIKFIEIEMKKIAPNFSAVAGSLLAARLLGEAGSLRKLALMPSSTVQLLGAEKALFRHLKNRQVNPPKHGVIFVHPLIQKAKRGNRGKMARALAGKLCIAARTDFFGNKEISARLLKELEAKAKELK